MDRMNRMTKMTRAAAALVIFVILFIPSILSSCRFPPGPVAMRTGHDEARSRDADRRVEAQSINLPETPH